LSSRWASHWGSRRRRWRLRQVERSGVDNWDNRRVLSQNTDKEKTLASMQRIADIRAQHKAQLWTNQ
jgi:hypothetical protein